MTLITNWDEVFTDKEFLCSHMISKFTGKSMPQTSVAINYAKGKKIIKKREEESTCDVSERTHPYYYLNKEKEDVGGRPTVITEEIAKFIDEHPNASSYDLSKQILTELNTDIHYNTISKYRKLDRPQSVTCKHCGSNSYRAHGERKLKSGSYRSVYMCNDCKRKFSTNAGFRFDIKTRRTAMDLHNAGKSSREIARTLSKEHNIQVTPVSILRWINEPEQLELVTITPEQAPIEILCPECGSDDNWKEGTKTDKDGTKRQKYFCKKCAHKWWSEKVRKSIIQKSKKQKIICPNCDSDDNWKEGTITEKDGTKKQRYSCKKCSHKWADEKVRENVHKHDKRKHYRPRGRPNLDHYTNVHELEAENKVLKKLLYEEIRKTTY